MFYEKKRVWDLKSVLKPVSELICGSKAASKSKQF